MQKPYNFEQATNRVQEAMSWLEEQKDTTHYMDLLLKLAEHHRAMMDRLGLSPATLATKLGKSRAEVHRWVSAQQNMTLSTIAKLDTALGTESLMVLPAGISSKQVMDLLSEKGLLNSESPDAKLATDSKVRPATARKTTSSEKTIMHKEGRLGHGKQFV